MKSLQDYGILILYQPTAAFKSVLDLNKGAGLNTFIITGTNTDFEFLNQIQTSFVFKPKRSTKNSINGDVARITDKKFIY